MIEQRSLVSIEWRVGNFGFVKVRCILQKLLRNLVLYHLFVMCVVVLNSVNKVSIVNTSYCEVISHMLCS